MSYARHLLNAILLYGSCITTDTHAIGFATEYTQILNHMALVKTVEQLSEELKHQLESLNYLRRHYLAVLINMHKLAPDLLYSEAIDQESQRLSWITDTHQAVSALQHLYAEEQQYLIQEIHAMNQNLLSPDEELQTEAEQLNTQDHLLSQQHTQEEHLLEQTQIRTQFLSRLLHKAPQLQGHEETLALLVKLNEMSLQESLEQKTLLTRQLSSDQLNIQKDTQKHWAQNQLYQMAHQQDKRREDRDAAFWEALSDPPDSEVL